MSVAAERVFSADTKSRITTSRLPLRNNSLAFPSRSSSMHTPPLATNIPHATPENMLCTRFLLIVALATTFSIAVAGPVNDRENTKLNDAGQGDLFNLQC